MVINTTPLIAVSVAAGSFDVLRVLYSRVVVTHEVQQEILAGGRHGIWLGKDVKQFLYENK